MTCAGENAGRVPGKCRTCAGNMQDASREHTRSALEYAGCMPGGRAPISFFCTFY